jgi:hypothetical protein
MNATPSCSRGTAPPAEDLDFVGRADGPNGGMPPRVPSVPERGTRQLGLLRPVAQLARAPVWPPADRSPARLASHVLVARPDSKFSKSEPLPASRR